MTKLIVAFRNFANAPKTAYMVNAVLELHIKLVAAGITSSYLGRGHEIFLTICS
jgi:hypothetical protein